jgi:alpha-D-ribose 1-methylphosphonate 5-triphosphate synthase subunit PhnI
MTVISQRLLTDYSGKDAGIDVLIQRYIDLEADLIAWREQIAIDGLVHKTETGFLLAHPLLKVLLTGEKQQHYTIREMLFAVRLTDWHKDDVDDVDAFLAQMETTNRPHFGRIRGE